MSTELTVLNNQDTSLATSEGGLGVDFSSKLFQLKPATLGVVQSNTNIEGAIKGKLRISETGDQFDEMICTLLVMPEERRSYYLKIPGNDLNRNPENLLCSSRDMVKPDAKAKLPQAMACKSCPQSDWGPWRKKFEDTKVKDKDLIPPCDAFYYAVLIDTVYQMPLQMFIRSKAKAELEAACQNISRRLAMMKAQGKEPNIFDISFKLKTKKIQTGQYVSYVPSFSDFAGVTPEQREKFGDIYRSFIAAKSKPQDDATDEEQVLEANQSINSVVSDDTIDGEIAI